MKNGLIQPSTRGREYAAVPSACWSGLSGTDLGLVMQAGVGPGLERREKVGEAKKVRCLNF